VSLVISKQSVADHGVVFTPAWRVEAMPDFRRCGFRFDSLTLSSRAAKQEIFTPDAAAATLSNRRAAS